MFTHDNTISWQLELFDKSNRGLCEFDQSDGALYIIDQLSVAPFFVGCSHPMQTWVIWSQF